MPERERRLKLDRPPVRERDPYAVEFDELRFMWEEEFRLVTRPLSVLAPLGLALEVGPPRVTPVPPTAWTWPGHEGPA